MGKLLVLTLISSFMLAVLFMVYKWLLSNEKQPMANRSILLSFYLAAPLAAIMIMLPISVAPTPQTATGLTLDNTRLILLGRGQAGNSIVPALLIGLWLAGIVVAISKLVADTIAIMHLSGKCEKKECEGMTVMVCPDDIAPFSFGRRIFLSSKDFSQDCSIIIRHEAAHISHRHSLDLVLASLVAAIQWFNPAAWLMLDELKTVHEYQADRDVLRSGIDARSYQLLLIKKAVGGSFPAIANNLNHSKLKKRITMMQKSKPGRWRSIRALVLLPATAAAALMINTPSVASTLGFLSSTKFTFSQPTDKGTKNFADANVFAESDNTCRVN